MKILNKTGMEERNALALLSATLQKTITDRILGAKAIVSSLSDPAVAIRLHAHRSVSATSQSVMGSALEESRTSHSGEKDRFCFEVVIPLPDAIAFSDRRDEFAMALARDVVSTQNPLLFLADSMNRFPSRGAFDCAEQIRRDLKKVAPRRPVQTIIVDDQEPVIPLDAWVKSAGVAIAERYDDEYEDDEGEDTDSVEQSSPTSIDLRLFVEVEVALDGRVNNMDLVELCQLLKSRLRESLHGIIMRADFIVSRSELKQV